MLKSRIFLRKTKRGGILKIVREHYLRDDLVCGSEVCTICQQEDPVLCRSPVVESDIVTVPHYILPDIDVVLHQIDILEHEAIKNVITLQLVLQEVRHRSSPAHKRLSDVLANRDKNFYVFMNEFHKDTYIERKPGESTSDRNDRAIRAAALWYKKHLMNDSLEIVLLASNAQRRDAARGKGITSYTVEEYVKSVTKYPELLDKLAQLDQDRSHAPDADIFDGRRITYPEHLPLSELQAGIRAGKYKSGAFHASRENYLEANVTVQDSDEAVFIQGHSHLNRSVDEDVVAVEILPRSQWKCPSSMMLEDKTEAPDDEEAANDDLEEGTNSHRLVTGRVVGIIKRKWRQYCGILQPSTRKDSTRHLFVPAEKKIPKICVETRQAAVLQGQRIVVCIDSWPRHSRYPQGHFVRRLGEVGDKETENEVLLLEHDVAHSAFSEAVLSFLPKMPWSISEEDLEKRTDLRHLDICSVDPPGCTDIDDALHCRPLDNGNVEAGVHIADVTHFVRPGSALDREASARGTTVYLVDRRIDMVPELLSSNLCSLRDDGDRLAFSCIWELTADAEIVRVRFMKSIIRSKASLTYAEAQGMIDDVSRDDSLAVCLRNLNRLAKILNKRRIEQGALSLASSEVRFHMDSETHDPVDVQTKQMLETNSMVEEMMLLANISVAKRIYKEFPQLACLRRHPAPPPSNYDPLVKAAASKGFTLDINSSKGLADSLNLAVIKTHPYFNTMLRIKATRCMMQAVYFCSGSLPETEFHHYGLASPIYTHFTSPIRRYADIMVHRLLAAAIGADATYSDLMDPKKVQSTCNNLNFRHRMGQYAGRASVALHTLLFFKNRVVDDWGYVLFIRKNALQVLIPKYGLEGTVWLKSDDPACPEFVFNEEDNTMTAAGVTFHVFDRVTVRISIDSTKIQHQKVRMQLVRPAVLGFSVPENAGEETTNTSQSAPAKKQRKS